MAVFRQNLFSLRDMRNIPEEVPDLFKCNNIGRNLMI